VKDLFKQYHQPDLMTVYQTGSPLVRKIGFVFGCKHLTGDTALIQAHQR